MCASAVIAGNAVAGVGYAIIVLNRATVKTKFVYTAFIIRNRTDSINDCIGRPAGIWLRLLTKNSNVMTTKTEKKQMEPNDEKCSQGKTKECKSTDKKSDKKCDK